MQELQALTGVRVRTLRHWIRKKLLAKPAGKGRGARYNERHLQRAKVIGLMRSQRKSLREIRSALDRLSDDELPALLPKPKLALTPEGIPVPPPPPSYPAVSWEHVVLVDGLVLMVDASKGQLLRRVADEIYRHYGVK